MGGDHGPQVTVPAALDFLRENPDARIILVGRQEDIRPLVAGEDSRVSIHDAREVVGMDEPPANALRTKKDSSMRQAINLVKEGRAAACISAGNTGALMAIARFVLKMLPGIDRPAICTVLPTHYGHTHMLDLGANVDCEPEHLLQFGIMGATLVAAIEGTPRPTVGLLNIGEEDIKGNETVKRAAELLRESGLNFVGNVALKVSEGLAQMLSTSLKEEFGRSLLSKLSALVALPVLKKFKHRFDHRRYNGATLLGLKGIVIKSHGSADRFAFRHALQVGYKEARGGVLAEIERQMNLRASNAAAVSGETS